MAVETKGHEVKNCIVYLMIQTLLLGPGPTVRCIYICVWLLVCVCVCIIRLEEMDYEWVQSGTKKYREGFVLSKIVTIWDKQVILKIHVSRIIFWEILYWWVKSGTINFIGNGNISDISYEKLHFVIWNFYSIANIFKSTML